MYYRKRKARVSFANLDELVYFDTDGAALGLGGGPPAAKKPATVSTPTRKRTSLAEIPASVLANKECAIEAIQSVQEGMFHKPKFRYTTIHFMSSIYRRAFPTRSPYRPILEDESTRCNGHPTIFR